MKIYILTQPLGYNYGAILQNYALQQVLLQKGCSPSTVMIDRVLMKSLILDYVKIFLKKTIFHFKYAKSMKRLKQEFPLKQKLRDFVDSHIIKTTCFYRVSSINSFFREHGKDCMIVIGSDQVWRPIYSPYLPLFFCASKTLKGIPHFSYAASFGVDTCEFSAKQKKMAQAYLPLFKGVSVREKSAVKICQEHFHYDNACLVPDPTLLLAGDEYRKLFESVTPQKGLACYFLDYTEQKKSMAEKFAAENGKMSVNELLPMLPQEEVLKQKIMSISIPEWLSGIANADYVMTDSFHGTVFSILFHRQFVVTPTVDRGNARLKDLLADLGLSERLVDINDYETVKKVLKTPVDYDAAEQKLALLRKTGMAFLEENLR